MKSRRWLLFVNRVLVFCFTAVVGLIVGLIGVVRWSAGIPGSAPVAFAGIGLIAISVIFLFGLRAYARRKYGQWF
jgi:hypothetical protein